MTVLDRQAVMPRSGKSLDRWALGRVPEPTSRFRRTQSSSATASSVRSLRNRNGEEILPSSLKDPTLRHHWRAGAAVQEQQDRIIRIVAAHADPLLDAADVQGLQLVDTAGSNRLRLGDGRTSRIVG